MPRDPATTVTLDDLGTIVRLVRELGPPSQPAPRRPTAILALLIAFLAISPAAPRAAARRAFLPSSLPPIEESQMRMLRNLGVVSSIAIASSATAQDAVQWHVEDGGNGHWYRIVTESAPISWDDALKKSLGSGGVLCVVTSDGEWSFVRDLSQSNGSSKRWLGASRGADALDWAWVTGEAFEFSAWGSTSCPSGPYPNNPAFDRVALGIADYCGNPWDDFLADIGEPVLSFVVEWSSDCNADGIVDYGQILAGELVDTNANNVPDCCEGDVPCGCVADFNGDGSVTSADFANLLTAWGATDLPPEDLDRNGIVDANDMAILLDSWGPCR